MEPPGCKDARKFYFSGVCQMGELTGAPTAQFMPSIVNDLPNFVSFAEMSGS